MWQRLKKLYADRKNLKNSINWLAKISAPNKRLLIILMVVNCVLTAIGVASSAVNKYIVDEAMNFSTVLPYIVVAVLFAGISIAGSVFLNIFTVNVTEKYSFHIRCEMYRHILKSMWTERTSFHSEGLLSRITSDASAVTNGIINVVSEIITTIVQFVLAFALLWYYDASLAVVALVSGPVAAVVSVYMGLRLKKIQVNIQQSEADYREYLQEHISHADVIKVFGQENTSIDDLAMLQKNRYFWIKKKNKLTVYCGAIISFVFSFTYLFAFITGAFGISNGEITYGTMTAFLGLMGQVQVPVMALAKLIPQFVGILASAGRIMEISQMKEEQVIEDKQLDFNSVGLKFDDVTLCYDDNVIIDKFSLDVRPGETVMLAGSSGIGKTTLLRAVLGFLAPERGSVTMYDNDASVICSAQTIKYLSYVPQGNTLFSGTIRDNLRIANHDATVEEMWQALEYACAADFVKALPDGLDTVVGERGCGLSEGQAQRISIARAVLKPFGLVILDEATSALDEATEAKILENMCNIKHKKTCLFVSHRETVGKYADRIVEIK